MYDIWSYLGRLNCIAFVFLHIKSVCILCLTPNNWANNINNNNNNNNSNNNNNNNNNNNSNNNNNNN